MSFGEPKISHTLGSRDVVGPALRERIGLHGLLRERFGSFDLQHLKAIRPVLRIDLDVDERFKQCRRWIQAAIDYGTAFCVPSPRDIKAACSVQRRIVADSPQDHNAKLRLRIRNRVATASLLPAAHLPLSAASQVDYVPRNDSLACAANATPSRPRRRLLRPGK